MQRLAVGMGVVPESWGLDVIGLVDGHRWFALAVAAGVVAGIGTVHDYRHMRRRDRDRVSLVAWGKVSALALIVAIVAVAKALRAG